MSTPQPPAGDTAPAEEPRRWTLKWAVRAVPAVVALGALDLLSDGLPIVFLVLTLVRLGLGVATLVALRYGAREEWCVAYLLLVLATALVTPERAAVQLAFAGLALMMTIFDLRRRRTAATT